MFVPSLSWYNNAFYIQMAQKTFSHLENRRGCAPALRRRIGLRVHNLERVRGVVGVPAAVGVLVRRPGPHLRAEVDPIQHEVDRRDELRAAGVGQVAVEAQQAPVVGAADKDAPVDREGAGV
jgi:hypothetical protein